MGKPAFCIGKNTGAVDQRLCFRYTDSTIPLLSKSKIFSLYPSSVQPSLCQTWSEPKLLYFSGTGSYSFVIFSGLVVRHGKPEDVIPELVQKLGTDTVQALAFQEEVNLLVFYWCCFGTWICLNIWIFPKIVLF